MARQILDDETKLDQDAEIYKKKTKEDEEKIRKNMTGKEKIQFFKDYYLQTVIVVIVVAILAIWAAKDFFTPDKEVVLYVAVVDDSLGIEETDKMQKELEELYDIDPETQEIVLNTGFSSSNLDSMAQLTTYMYADEVDVVICSQKEFDTLAETGHFEVADSEGITSFYEDVDEEHRAYAVPEETDEEGNRIEGTGEPMNFGVYLQDSQKMKDWGSVLDTSCAGIVITSKHKDNAVKFLKYMMDMQ